MKWAEHSLIIRRKEEPNLTHLNEWLQIRVLAMKEACLPCSVHRKEDKDEAQKKSSNKKYTAVTTVSEKRSSILDMWAVWEDGALWNISNSRQLGRQLLHVRRVVIKPAIVSLRRPAACRIVISNITQLCTDTSLRGEDHLQWRRKRKRTLARVTRIRKIFPMIIKCCKRQAASSQW